MTMEQLHDINRIVLKLNEIEDSKEGQPSNKRIELADRQIPLYKELHAKLGEIVCRF